jgi:hypothetical protein
VRPAPRALRALLQPCIQFCDGLHPQSLSPLHQGYDIVGFHAPPWLVREHIALEERAVERACTIGEDRYAHGERRARGDCRRHHGHVDGIIELEEVGELQFVVGLVPAECAAAARAAEHAPRRVKAASLALLAVLVAAACHAASQSDHFEYPPYFSWELGSLWVVLAFSGLSLAALLAPAASEHVATVQGPVTGPTDQRAPYGVRSTRLPHRVGNRMGARRRLLTLLPAVTLLAVGVAPYIGIRTHPALAMFSNLRIEGGASNHWGRAPRHAT